MYVRVSNSGGRQYLRLVEAYRDDKGKVRQRHIAQLGRVDQLDERAVNGLINSLRRFSKQEASVEAEPGQAQFAARYKATGRQADIL